MTRIIPELELLMTILQTGELISQNVVDQARQVCPTILPT